VVLDDAPVAIGRDDRSALIRMEGLAIVAALKIAAEHTAAGRPSSVIYTDSASWAASITEYAEGWAARGWCRSDGNPIRNAEIFERAHHLYNASNAILLWVHHHQHDPGNEMATNGRTAPGWANSSPREPKDRSRVHPRPPTVASDATEPPAGN
jgi:hypothetical protein